MKKQEIEMLERPDLGEPKECSEDPRWKEAQELITKWCRFGDCAKLVQKIRRDWGLPTK